MSARRLILLAGPSGCGKSRLARAAHETLRASWLRLDDFYFDEDVPGLPRTLGIVDWDDPRTWDVTSAMRAVERLLFEGRAEVPVYDISLSRRVGTQTLEAATTIVAEGIFAVTMLASCKAAGVDVDAIWIDRGRVTNFSRRLARDLREHRKPPVVLVRRGLALARSEALLREKAIANGFEPYSMREAYAHIARLS